LAEKLAETFDYFIGLAGISFVLLLLHQKSKTQPHFKVYGLNIKTILRIGYFGIAIFIILIVQSFF